MNTLIHRNLWSLLLAGSLLLASGCSKSNSPAAAATTPSEVQKEEAPKSGEMEAAPNEPGESAAEAPSGDSDSDESDTSYDAAGDGGDDEESTVEEDGEGEEDGEDE